MLGGDVVDTQVDRVTAGDEGEITRLLDGLRGPDGVDLGGTEPEDPWEYGDADFDGPVVARVRTGGDLPVPQAVAGESQRSEPAGLSVSGEVSADLGVSPAAQDRYRASMGATPSVRPSISDSSVGQGREGFMARAVRVRHPGRAWAYTGAISAGVFSVAANVVSVLPGGVSARVLPWVSGLWPVFLFFGFEILVRTVWVPRYKWAGWLGMTAVVSVPAIVSYRHMYHLIEHMGEDRVVSIMGPLAVDGLMLMATMALMSMAQAHRDRTAGERGSGTFPPELDDLFRSSGRGVDEADRDGRRPWPRRR
jgi:hypothetical protein